MNRPSKSIILKGVAAAVVMLSVIIPDLVFGALGYVLHIVWELVSELLHLVWELVSELLHLVFEGLEVSLDFVIEHLFETDLRSTQIIVFYIIMGIFGFFGYMGVRWLAAWWRRWLDRLTVKTNDLKTQAKIHWQGVPMYEKVTWATLTVLFLMAYLSFGL